MIGLREQAIYGAVAYVGDPTTEAGRSEIASAQLLDINGNVDRKISFFQSTVTVVASSSLSTSQEAYIKANFGGSASFTYLDATGALIKGKADLDLERGSAALYNYDANNNLITIEIVHGIGTDKSRSAVYDANRVGGNVKAFDYSGQTTTIPSGNLKSGAGYFAVYENQDKTFHGFAPSDFESQIFQQAGLLKGVPGSGTITFLENGVERTAAAVFSLTGTIMQYTHNELLYVNTVSLEQGRSGWSENEYLVFDKEGRIQGVDARGRRLASVNRLSGSVTIANVGQVYGTHAGSVTYDGTLQWTSDKKNHLIVLNGDAIVALLDAAAGISITPDVLAARFYENGTALGRVISVHAENGGSMLVDRSREALVQRNNRGQLVGGFDRSTGAHLVVASSKQLEEAKQRLSLEGVQLGTSKYNLDVGSATQMIRNEKGGGLEVFFELGQELAAFRGTGADWFHAVRYYQSFNGDLTINGNGTYAMARDGSGGFLDLFDVRNSDRHISMIEKPSDWSKGRTVDFKGRYDTAPLDGCRLPDLGPDHGTFDHAPGSGSFRDRFFQDR